MKSNKALIQAKETKNDEFYTYFTDICDEVKMYKEQLKGKTIYLPCDSQKSSFWEYFIRSYADFDLNGLYCTFKTKDGEAALLSQYSGLTQIDTVELIENGDFRSAECIQLLDKCDVVITNPPFSLFREFVDLLEKHNKKFLIIGNENAMTSKKIFKMVKENKIWTGYHQVKSFFDENGEEHKFGNICWYTNLDIVYPEKKQQLELTEEYLPSKYPKLDNYDARLVNTVKAIPKRYKGILAVPISFLKVYDKERFEIIGCSAFSDPDCYGTGPLYYNGKKLYVRILIRNKV